MKNLIFFILGLLSLLTTVFADSVRIIDSGEEAYQVRTHLLESAKKEIQISYFIFAQDKTALEVLTLLRKKAREGVKVRVLIDDMFDDIPKDIGAHLSGENVEIRNFNKFNFLKFGKSIRYRMHDKMFIVDQEKIIMGGRNIEDTYYGRAKKNYDDRDVFMIGKIAQTASEYFNEVWDSDHVIPLKKSTLDLARAEEILDQAANGLDLDQNFMSFNLKEFESQTIEVESIELFHDHVKAVKDKMTGTALHLYELINHAKSTVHIDSPYLIMTKELKAVLQNAIDRGVKVRILTNSLKSTDGLFPQAGYIGQRRKIVRMGVELYEFNSDESFHAKSMVIDNEIAAIGSFNFDPRSQNLNTETMAIIRDPKAAALLSQSMDETLKVAYKIDQSGKPEGQSSRLPGVSLKKKILTRLIQVLVVPFTKGLL